MLIVSPFSDYLVTIADQRCHKLAWIANHRQIKTQVTHPFCTYWKSGTECISQYGTVSKHKYLLPHYAEPLLSFRIEPAPFRSSILFDPFLMASDDEKTKSLILGKVDGHPCVLARREAHDNMRELI